MEINILPVKQKFYPGETILGEIQIIPNQKISLENINIEMFLSFSEEWNYLHFNKKIETVNNNQNISIFDLRIKYNILEPKKYTFPFKSKLPDYLLPSFEYFKEKYKAFLRYALIVKIKSSNNEISSKVYIIINSIPKIDNKNLIIEDASLSVKKWGMFNRGQTTLQAFYLTKNYRLSDNIPIEIEINNTNSTMKVEKCEFYFIRKLIFKDKELFIEKYCQEDILIKKEYESIVQKKEKQKFNFNIDLKTINYKDFNYEGIENKQYNPADLLPSLDGNIISCEYSLKIKLKYAHKVPKEYIPTVILPIYIVHKLEKDHIEIIKKESEKIKKNEIKKNL